MTPLPDLSQNQMLDNAAIFSSGQGVFEDRTEGVFSAKGGNILVESRNFLSQSSHQEGTSLLANISKN